jgi:hypothetical protein
VVGDERDGWAARGWGRPPVVVAQQVAQLERERDRLRLRRRRRRRRRRPSSLEESPRRAWTAGVRAVRIPERAMVASFGCGVRVFPG